MNIVSNTGITAAVEKENYTAFDFFKIVASFLVLAAHIHPFESLNGTVSYAFDYVVCRAVVPLFFLITGFFVYNGLNDRAYTEKYVRKILRLYLVYTVIYIPVNLIDYISSGKSPALCILSYVRNFFLLGVVPPLWYFIGTAFAVVIIRLLAVKAKLTDIGMFFLSLSLYVIGVLFGTYKELFLGLPVVGPALKLYLFVFETTRSGLFYGVFFIFLGGMIRKYSAKIKKSFVYPVLGVFFLLCMMIESFTARNLIGGDDRDMLFFAFPAGVFIFLTLLFLKVPPKYAESGKTLRKASVIIFGLHPFVSFWLEFPMNAVGITNSLIRYVLIAAVLSIITAILIRLSRKNNLPKLLF